MKTAFIIIVAMLAPAFAEGQVAAELFQQGQAQTRSLMQQIAALKVYIGYAQKGYSIAKDGLDDIGKLKKGDLNLHSGYFSSLKAVNPKIRAYSKAVACIQVQKDILTAYRDTKKKLAHDGLLTAEETGYVEGVYNALLEDCIATMEELRLVTTGGELQMTDDERIKQIDRIYSGMQSRYMFVQAFSGQAKILAAARRQDRNEVKNSRVINGVK